MRRSRIHLLAAACYSLAAVMIFGFIGRRKLFRVLDAAKSGIYCAEEIAMRANLSRQSVAVPLNVLEREGHLTSGTLAPGDLKVYRVTRKGQEALASRSFS